MKTEPKLPSAALQGGGRFAPAPFGILLLSIFGRFFMLFHRVEGLFAGGPGVRQPPREQ